MERLSSKIRMHIKEMYSCRVPERKTIGLLNAIANVLAEYEDLEEQGKLLKLPCAIGDIVYWILGTEILQMEIEYFQILPNKIKFSFKYCGGGGRLENFTKYMYESDIGKNVFLTREEAALKELEEE